VGMAGWVVFGTRRRGKPLP